MPQKLEEALTLQKQLRCVFEATKGGAKDLRTLNLVRHLCSSVNDAVPDVVCRDRVGQLENLADALFADRKHQKWVRSRKTSSVLALRHRAYAALDELERRLHYVMAARRNEVIRRECNASIRTAQP